MTAATAVTPAYFLGPDDARPWLRSHAGWTSLGLHATAALLLWNLATDGPPAPPPARTIELTLETVKLPPPPPPPPPKKIEPPPEQPVLKPRVAPPPLMPAPSPRTVDAPAAEAETVTPVPAPPQPVVPPPPPAPPPPPPAPEPPATKVVQMSQIPSDYTALVFAAINRNASYPSAARMRRQEARIPYKLTIDASGKLVKYEIEASGIESLDSAARSAIKAGSPFPPAPNLGGDLYLLSGAIVFRIS